MNKHLRLLSNNKAWAAQQVDHDEEFFKRLTEQQSPQFLWIGCADSRVPANEIVGLLPGELFVHRNVANVVVHTDLNCLSVIQYAVDVLNVRHVIVCGHYGCGGVGAVVENRSTGLADNWLNHVRDVQSKHCACLDALPGTPERIDRLCELNVIEQVRNVARTTILRDAWARGQEIWVHGWVYSLNDGLLQDLHVTVGANDPIETTLAAGLNALLQPGALPMEPSQ
jgi:carbonic anhydrase